MAIQDAEGDVAVDYPPSGTPYAGPVADGVDLVGALLAQVNGTFQVTLVVKDLAALEQTAVGVQADTMLFLQWEEQGRLTGRWVARADYQPGNTEPWHFWIEGPCLDGDDTDGCAGGDRDIQDGLQGVVDLTGNSVTILVTADRLRGPDANASWSRFVARTDAVWPSYPMYIGDSAQDLAATTVHPFGTAPIPANASEEVSVNLTATFAAAPPSNATSAAPTKDAPGVPSSVVVVALAFAVQRRQRSSRVGRRCG